MLEARQGQTMIVNLRSVPRDADMTLNIEAPGGESLMPGMETSWSGKLPRTGLYQIAIGLIESKTGNYTLEVIITN